VAQLYPQASGTHFSRLLWHAWVTVGLFLFPGHHTGIMITTRGMKFSSALRYAIMDTLSPLSLEVYTRTGSFPFVGSIFPGVLFNCKPVSSTLKMSRVLSESWFASHIFSNRKNNA
jgi:hypothetical protein